MREAETPTPADFRFQERGVGVVFPPYGSGTEVDTVTVWEAPEPGSPPLARLVRSFLQGSVLETVDEVLEGGALEFGYEELGLPVVEPVVDSAPEWLRVRWATSTDGRPLDGWVRFDPARLEFLPWTERLPELPLFFLDEDSVRFHVGPGAAPADVELARSGSPPGLDYILYPLETEGPWMRVEAVTPSDYCFDPSAPRRDTAWVRYLDERDRPRVWYFTRGC